MLGRSVLLLVTALVTSAMVAGCATYSPQGGSGAFATPADPGSGTATGPVGVDSDGDGVSDDDEIALGSDPQDPDTDGDGWDDGEEVNGNTDPLEALDHPYTGGWAIGACRYDLVSTGNGFGHIVEDFELMDQFGEAVRLHDFCDREVLLVGAAFW